MKHTLFFSFLFLVLGSLSFARPLNPFCAHETLFGPCGVGSAGPGGYYGITYPAGYWPPYFTPGHHLYLRRYAAIAYAEDGSGRYGVSWNRLTLEDANLAALSFCGNPSCTVKVWSLNGCAALSAARVNPKLWGVGWNNNRESARATATLACKRTHKTPCHTIISVCNGW